MKFRKDSRITTVLFMITSATVFIFISYSDKLLSQQQQPISKQNVNISSVSPQTEFHTLGQTDVELFPEPFMLANIPNFTYVLNRDICRGEPVDLLVLVGSHPANSAMRKVLRHTWGRVREDKYVVKLMFPIGRPNDSVLQQQMIDESAAYGDVVQGSFLDHYNMVTIRDLMSFHWTWKQCPQARFVMHIDDDICMDIDHMLDALEEQMPKDNDYVACFSHLIGGEVLRSGKYGLSKEEHYADIYDHYCLGWAYWLTPRAAKQLDKAALRHFPYRMNDAYLTGTLMTDLGWNHLTVDIQVTGNVDLQNYLNSTEDAAPKYFMGHNGMNATLAELVHKRFHMYSIKHGIPMNRSNISISNVNATNEA